MLRSLEYARQMEQIFREPAEHYTNARLADADRLLAKTDTKPHVIPEALHLRGLIALRKERAGGGTCPCRSGRV